jgi:hypothetical protein
LSIITFSRLQKIERKAYRGFRGGGLPFRQELDHEFMLSMGLQHNNIVRRERNLPGRFWRLDCSDFANCSAHDPPTIRVGY